MINLMETERLILRELEFFDASDLFEMDADTQVHLYIENTPDKTIDETKNSIAFFKKQGEENGFSVLAVVHKQTKECLGWSGLLFSKQSINNYINFYELGFRFKKKHWGKGYATESSTAVLKLAFKNLKVNAIYAMADRRNFNSKKVLLKLGFQFKNTFDCEGDLNDWFELGREDWNVKNTNR
jgi:[ribosomal protein S5]-alanine N-acetyltransferase